MAKAVKKKKELTLEEKLAEALVPAEEQPYQVPENWDYYRINGISVHLKRGKAPKYVDHSDILVFAQKCNQKDGTIAMEKAQFLDPERAARINADEFLKDKDVLINSTGTGTLGRVGFYRSHYALPYERVLPDSHMTVVRAIKIVNPQYLFYFLKSNQDYLELQGAGTTNQKELKPESIGNIIFPLPPLPEQQRIVDRIERLFAKLDEAKDKAQAVVDGFEDRKAAILHKAFTGELTKEWRKIHKISFNKTWEKKTIVDLCSIIVDCPHSTPKWTDTGRICLRTTNIKDGYLDLTEVQFVSEETYEERIQRAIPMPGDVLLTREGNIGDVGVIPDGTTICLGQRMMLLRPDKCQSNFLVYFFRNPKIISEIKAKTMGSTAPRMNIKDLKKLSLLCPSYQEQYEVVRILDNLLLKEKMAIEAAEQVISQIDTMKKSILARAFRGELGTNDPADESAVELLKRIL